MATGVITRDMMGFLDEVNKGFGKGAITRLSEQPPVQRIPTGITELDIALGGGWVRGGINLVWGKKSAGKTSLITRAIQQAQMLDRHTGMPLGDPALDYTSDLPLEPEYYSDEGELVDFATAHEPDKKVEEDMRVSAPMVLKKGYMASEVQEAMNAGVVNAEQTFDLKWARDAIGADPSGIHMINTDTAEDAIDIVDSAIRKNALDLIIIDSLAMLTPSKETEETAHNWQQALQPRLLSKAFRMWVSSLASYRGDPSRPTLLLVNQVREKTNVKYGSPEIKPGGRAQDFALSIEVFLSQGSIQDEDYAAKDAHQLVHRTNYRVTWNKTHPKGKKGQYLMAISKFKDYRPGNIVEWATLIDLFKKYGMLVQVKSKWELVGKSFPTQKALLAWAIKNPADFEFYRRALVDLVVKLDAGYL